jgi:hypothetical protein
VKRGLNGIGITAPSRGLTEKPQERSASIAAKDLILAMHGQKPDSAPTSVALTHAETEAMTTRNGPAATAVQSSLSTAMQRRSFARVNVRGRRVVGLRKVSREPVFNLATSDGTFFANGVLVSNCDALRYMIMGHRKYEGWESPKFVQRDERIAGRNAERAVRVASGRPYPSGRARSLVRFER